MMQQRIVYPLGQGIAVLAPIECGLTVQQIAAKDVPAGAPYLIVDAADIPADRTYRAAWTCDFSQPDGYGLGYVPDPEPLPEPEPAPDLLPHEIDENEQRLP